MTRVGSCRACGLVLHGILLTLSGREIAQKKLGAATD
jgi:hypothetical protein